MSRKVNWTGNFLFVYSEKGIAHFLKQLKLQNTEIFLSITVSRPLPHVGLVTSQETVTFDGIESEATIIGSPREKSSARWSDDGQTMTTNSVKSFKTISEDADITVTEVWN